MTDPRHIGPPCKRCGRPQATQAAWDELQGGEGPGLCWGTDTMECDMARTEVPVAELAALRIVAEEARNLARNIRCVCDECWTSRGRHAPEGCTWEDLEDLRSAVQALDAIPSSARDKP